jgi:hypothetical protein
MLSPCVLVVVFLSGAPLPQYLRRSDRRGANAWFGATLQLLLSRAGGGTAAAT